MPTLNETCTLPRSWVNGTALRCSRIGGRLQRMVTHLPAFVSVVMMLSGCTPAPTSPGPSTPPPVPPPPVTYRLSGTVTEMTSSGAAPVEGVRVEEQSSGGSVMTDANGWYSLSGAFGAVNLVSTTKAGYVSYRRTMTISGDTQLDIRVDRIVSYVLSGEVFEVTEAGRVPIEGVELYCDGCGSPDGHTFVVTDADGSYSFSWTLNGLNPLFVRKVGYAIVDATGLLDREGRVQVTVNGDTRFDIQLVRR